MIYITGDCHGDYRRFRKDIFPEQKDMTKEDYVIICGDFGFWDRSREQEYWMRWLEERPFTALWVDGNHENFDLLSEYPAELLARLYLELVHFLGVIVEKIFVGGLFAGAFGEFSGKHKHIYKIHGISVVYKIRKYICKIMHHCFF